MCNASATLRPFRIYVILMGAVEVFRCLWWSSFQELHMLPTYITKLSKRFYLFIFRERGREGERE